MWRLIFSIGFILFFRFAWSAACCGGGLSFPTMIINNDKAQFSSSYSVTNVEIDNVDDNGVWHRWDQHQNVQTLKLEGAHILADHWQIGASIPVISRQYGDKMYSGLGDILASVSYEYLSDQNNDSHSPMGIGFLQLNLPTGKSRADSEVGGLDSRGNGFWALGAGTLLSKSWSPLDFFLLFEGHRSFEKNVNTSLVKGTVLPGYGSNISFGFGYNWAMYRAGFSLTQNQEDAVIVRTEDSKLKQDMERWSTMVLSISYLQWEFWSWTMSYSDQTVFGDPVNTSLGKSFGLQIQHRWAR